LGRFPGVNNDSVDASRTILEEQFLQGKNDFTAGMCPVYQ